MAESDQPDTSTDKSTSGAVEVQNQCTASSEQTFDLFTLTDDKVYQALKRHFIRDGKGRPPDRPRNLDVTNRLLLQLHFLKEETQESCDQLKSWLEKLVPETEHVTVGRIRHRIDTLPKMCVTLSKPACLHVLDQLHDFFALAEPLAALGLTRHHLTGSSSFQGQALSNIRNDVVMSLENFRSQDRQPAAFVTKWLRLLCSESQKLTPNQVKLRVEKVAKRVKTYRKKGQTVELREYLKLPFIESRPPQNPKTEPEPNPLIGQLQTKVDVLASDLKEKEKDNKNLLEEIEVSHIVRKDLESKVEILSEEIKESRKEKKMLKATVIELKSAEKESKYLKTLTSDLQSKVDELKSKKTYKPNGQLKSEKASSELKSSSLEKEVKQSKASCSHEEVIDLKRKLSTEQAEKSKWKKKYRKLNESLVVGLCDKSFESAISDKEEDLLNLRENPPKKTPLAKCYTRRFEKPDLLQESVFG